MNKSRIFIGASAVILAIASAFSTKSLKAGTHPYHHTQANESGACKTYLNLCTAGTHQVWTQGAKCTQFNQAFTDPGCLNQLFTNKNISQ